MDLAAYTQFRSSLHPLRTFCVVRHYAFKSLLCWFAATLCHCQCHWGSETGKEKKKEEERSNRDQSHNPASVILINIYLILNMKDVRIYIQNSIHTQSFLFCLMSPHPCHLSPFHHYNILALSSPGFGLTSDPAAGSLEFCT